MERKLTIPIVVTVIVVIGISMFWCRWLPWYCPICLSCPGTVNCKQDCPVDCDSDCPAPEPAAQIILEDTHSAVWMALENSWVESPLGKDGACAKDDDGKVIETGLCAKATTTNFGDCTGDWSQPEADEGHLPFRHGALFQIGDVVVHNGVVQLFEKVILERAGGPPIDLLSQQTPAEVSGDRFDWIDVRSGTTCVIDPLHAYRLFRNTLVGMPCDAPPGGSCSAVRECLRGRALHASLDPSIGAITYWTGDNGYTAEPVGNVFGDTGYLFKLMNDVTVDVWLLGSHQKRYSDVKTITLKFKEPPTAPEDHNAFHDPPMDGGIGLQ